MASWVVTLLNRLPLIVAAAAGFAVLGVLVLRVHRRRCPALSGTIVEDLLLGEFLLAEIAILLLVAWH